MRNYFSKASNKLMHSIRKRLSTVRHAWVVLSGCWPVKPAGEGRPTRVAFICHMPALWSKLEPVYEAAAAEDDFRVFVLAAHRDSNVSRETAAFLTARGIPVAGGAVTPSTDLESLKPDYVFHSVPYDHFFPEHLRAEKVWAYARLCYVPYVGQLIYSNGVAETTHHFGYFRLLRLAFLADEWEKARLLKTLNWQGRIEGVKVVGSPHAEQINKSLARQSARLSCPPLVLWTPRWNTSEGNCHFFDYKDLLLRMSEAGEISLVFRPHPLCLPHLLKTGELTQQEHDRYLAAIDRCNLARLDQGGDYLESLVGAEIFVSDMSSVLGDAFLTGKPVIYTHRVDDFNELGRFMAEGFYWVRTEGELAERLRSLSAGNDPLKGKREELLSIFNKQQPPGAASRILEHIRKDRVCG